MALSAGCSEKKSSSEKAESSASGTVLLPEDFPDEIPTEPLTLAYNQQTITTEDRLFDFAINGALESKMNHRFEEYDYHFQIKEYDLHLAVLTVTDLHQSVEAFSEQIIKASGGSTELKGSAGEINGHPAYKASGKCADYGEDYQYGFAAVQYGAGDLFIVIGISPKGYAGYCNQLADDLLASVKYNGKDIPAEPQHFENDYFSFDIPTELYLDDSDKTSASVGITLQDHPDEVLCRFSIDANSGKSLDQVLQKLHLSLEDAESAQFAGRNAYYFRDRSTDSEEGDKGLHLTLERYMIPTGNCCYAVTVMATEETVLIFRAMLEPLFDSLNLIQ